VYGRNVLPVGRPWTDYIAGSQPAIRVSPQVGEAAAG
jgi:hypothetical protein